jgi:hypothetical protein
VVLLLAICGISSDRQAEDPTKSRRRAQHCSYSSCDAHFSVTSTERPSPQSLRFDLVPGFVWLSRISSPSIPPGFNSRCRRTLIINDSADRQQRFSYSTLSFALTQELWSCFLQYMASPPTDKQRIRQKAKSLRFDLVRGWVLSYFPVELRSSLFSIPVPSHERSFNVSSYPLFRLYSIITIPTAPCSSRLTQELQYYLQQRVGASCLFAYTPWLILSYESSSWIRRILIPFSDRQADDI